MDTRPTGVLADDFDSSWARELVDLAPIAFLATTVDGTIIHANPAAELLLGVAARDAVGTSLSSFVADTERANDLMALASATPPGERRVADLTVEMDGGVHRVVASFRRFDRAGRPFLAWAILDVEVQRAAEAELRRLTEDLDSLVRERSAAAEAERARLHAILGRLPAGVIVAEGPDARIVLTNAAAEVLLGTSPVVGASVLDDRGTAAFRPDGTRLEPQDWPLARTLVTGEAIRDERLRIERADGTAVTIEASTNVVRDETRPVGGAVVVFWDVSEREQRERAEREFVTNAAHELQTPLAAIVSAVEVLLGGAKDDPEDRDRFLAHIERESSRLVRLVRSLLVLARTQVARERLPTDRVALRALLDDVALGLRPRAGIEVVVRCAARLSLQTNRDLLEQAITNLAGNAARHTRQGRITLSAFSHDGSVQIEVADTGSGIDGDVERVFDRFYRGEARSSDGFGLGLSIVRETVTALGGSVSISDAPEGGTVACIVLPRTGMRPR